MMSATHHDTVAILDAGAQYGKLIDRRIRELSVKTDLLPLNTSGAELKKKGYKAIVISGGPNSVYAEDAPEFDEEVKFIWTLGKDLVSLLNFTFFLFADFALRVSRRTQVLRTTIPTLGICYGMQLVQYELVTILRQILHKNIFFTCVGHRSSMTFDI